MKDGFRQSMAWLHTWTGLVVGWVLYLIFVTGTAGYFDTEIDRWMQPERAQATPLASPAQGLSVAVAYLQRNAPEAERWFINLPGHRDSPDLRVFWNGQPEHDGRYRPSANELLDPGTGEPMLLRETGGGQWLYRMHWRLHYMPVNIAVLLVGICTMLMLVAIVTGIITHKKIFTDFFTFRPKKGQRSWLDAHNVVSVIALPFFVMITYSGLVFYFEQYMPAGVVAIYGPGQKASRQFFEEFSGRPFTPPASGTRAPLTDLPPLLETVEQRWGKNQIRFIEVRRAGDAAAEVTFVKMLDAPTRGTGRLVFGGVDGQLRETTADTDASAARGTYDVLLALHEGLFAGPALRWLYFISGLLGCAMIATGLILWTVKRAAKTAKRDAVGAGLKVVRGLNIGTIAGLPAAIAVYFWANRLLPIDLPERAAWEAHAMFLAWALMFAHAWLRPATRAWIEQWTAVAVLYALLPIVNAWTTALHLGNTLPQGDWVMAGFDLTMLALGITAALIARQVSRRAAVTQTRAVRG